MLSTKLKHKELSYLVQQYFLTTLKYLIYLLPNRNTLSSILFSTTVLSTELKHTELPHEYKTAFMNIPYINTFTAWKSSLEGKKIIIPDQLPFTQTTKKFPSK